MLIVRARWTLTSIAGARNARLLCNLSATPSGFEQVNHNLDGEPCGFYFSLFFIIFFATKTKVRVCWCEMVQVVPVRGVVEVVFFGLNERQMHAVHSYLYEVPGGDR